MKSERSRSLEIIFSWFLLLGSVNLFSQAVSPYTRYGLGYIRSTVFSANKGMGDLAAPYASAVNINYTNPASYASLTRTTLEIGANADGVDIVTKDSTYRAGNGNLSHFALAFVPSPKHNNWAISLGILPYTNVNYNFTQNYNDSSVGAYNTAYVGSGALYKFYVGGAYKVKGFSIGANLEYIFGKLDYEKIISFPDSVLAYNTRNTISLNAKSFYYSVGIQYQRLIHHNSEDVDRRNDIYATFGLYGSGGLKMNAKISSHWDRFYVDPYYGVIVTDTVQTSLVQEGKITMPINVGGGAMFGSERFWMVGADFKFSNWSSYSSPLNNGPLSNSWRVSLGAQITPKYDDRKFFNRVQYRVGGYFGKSEINFQGSHLSEGAVTFGFGLPFKNVAHLNIAGEIGSRGAVDPSLIHENFYRFTFGLVLNDIWFTKRKFD